MSFSVGSSNFKVQNPSHKHSGSKNHSTPKKEDEKTPPTQNQAPHDTPVFSNQNKTETDALLRGSLSFTSIDEGSTDTESVFSGNSSRSTSPVSSTSSISSGNSSRSTSPVSSGNSSRSTSSVSSTSSGISIAGGRGLVGPDSKGAINKKATCREMYNLLQLGSTDLKDFLPTLNDGIWVQTDTKPQPDTTSNWTDDELMTSGWKKMDGTTFKDYMSKNRLSESDTINIKMGCAGDSDFGTTISDIKLGTFPTPHMDRGTGRDSIWRKMTFKATHIEKTSGVTSAQYLDTATTSVKSHQKGSHREKLEKSQDGSKVFNDVIKTNMKRALEDHIGSDNDDVEDHMLVLTGKLDLQLQDLSDKLNSLQDSFYPSGMSILVAYEVKDGQLSPVIKLIDPDNCVFIAKDSKPDVKNQTFIDDIKNHTSDKSYSEKDKSYSGSVEHAQTMAKNIFEKVDTTYTPNSNNPYLETVRGGIASLRAAINAES